VLLIIVDLVPEDDVERFVNGLVRYMNITLKPETKVIIKQFAGARNLENVIAYTVGCTYPLRQELGWEFETNDTVFRDFSSQSTSKTIGGHVAFLYRKPVNDAELLNNEGVALYKLGKLEEAISCYDKALMANPVLAQAWCNKGLALYEIGRIEESVICLDKALEIKPEYKEAWHYKGLALLKIGKQQEAISCFDEALHIDPKDATAWFNRGSALFDLGRLNDSISCYERALEIDPKLLQAWNDKGLCLHKLGRSKEAITCYDNALNLDHRFAVAWCNKGDALAVLGRIHDAIEAYESFILYAPTQCVSYIQQVKDIIGRLKR
jgi:tetratricopeptide (TPR) repeat protein